jgi:hypothetical protein
MARRRDVDDDDKPAAPEAQPPHADDPDRAILRGGPGDLSTDPAAPAAPPATPPGQPPERTRVKIRGREFEVDPDMAREIEERERDYMRGIQMDRRERDELDRYRRAAQPAAQPEVYDYGVKLFENPTEALQRFGAEIEARLEKRYNQSQAAVAFWDKFYKDHPDLAEEQFLVEARLQTDYKSLADLPESKAVEILADNVRKDILRITRKARGAGGSVTPLPTGRATVEGATGDRPAPPATRGDADDDTPWSLSKEIRQRKEARRRAATKG